MAQVYRSADRSGVFHAPTGGGTVSPPVFIRDMRNHMGRIDSHITELRERTGHVEGLLQGLRDVFIRRTASG